MVTLCGDKYQSYGYKVLRLLQDTEISEKGRGLAMNVRTQHYALQYILRRMTVKLEELEIQAL